MAAGDSRTNKPLEDDYPPITSLEELVRKDELAEILGVKPATISLYRWGTPKLPYIRFGRLLLFSKVQVAWWLNRYQREVPDPYYLDRMRRVRKGAQIGRYPRQKPEGK